MFASHEPQYRQSRALLAAQGMFAVVGTYGMEHGWTKAPALPSTRC